jgi:hypothetical protein
MGLQERSQVETGAKAMSEMITHPRYGALQSQSELDRAEAVVNAFCEMYDCIVALFTRGFLAAKVMTR